MTHKIKDLAVVTGTYTDRQTGVQKNKYQTIGALMRTDDGGQFILLDPLINLAAVPRGQGKDRIMVSLFEPREPNNQQQQPPAAPNQPAAQHQTAQQFQQPPQPQNGYYNPDGTPMTPQQVQATQQGRS